MKTHTQLLVATGIFFIMVLCIIFWLSGPTPSIEGANKNNSYKNVTNEIQKFQSKFGISRWECDSEKNEITIYVYDIQDEKIINEFQDKKIENFTVRIIPDTEFERTRAEVTTYITQLQKNPEYQIARISMVTDAFGNPPGNYAELWVYIMTPENKKLDNSIVHGWKILVYPMAPLPTESSNPE